MKPVKIVKLRNAKRVKIFDFKTNQEIEGWHIANIWYRSQYEAPVRFCLVQLDDGRLIEVGEFR